MVEEGNDAEEITSHYLSVSEINNNKLLRERAHLSRLSIYASRKTKFIQNVRKAINIFSIVRF